MRVFLYSICYFCLLSFFVSQLAFYSLDTQASQQTQEVFQQPKQIDFVEIDTTNLLPKNSLGNPSANPQMNAQVDPSAILQLWYEPESTSPSVYDLLHWVHVNDDGEPEKYNRLEQFAGWVRQSRCVDTRTYVLTRDSLGPVEMNPKKPCNRVVSGEWIDPYVGKQILNSVEIQIDHVVPLKNAWQNGAWKWNHSRRCHYANFIKYPKHLLSVSSRENQRKSDRSPERYMPIVNRCKYLHEWLSIKAIWKLYLSMAEAQFIASEMKSCSIQDHIIDITEYKALTQQSENIQEGCQE